MYVVVLLDERSAVGNARKWKKPLNMVNYARVFLNIQQVF